MLRTALRPKWLALLALVVLVVIAFVQLGRWQMGVAEDKAHREALERARAQTPVALTSILRPHEDFPNALSARPLVATGRYDVERQFLVPQRRLEGRTGYWVMTPFVVAETGARIPVLRGFASEPSGIPAPPGGTVSLVGGLAPMESPYAGPPPPAGQLGSVDASVLVNAWPGELYNAFLFLEKQDPAPAAGLLLVPTPTGDAGFSWRNAAYAFQWWFFAAFALWMFVKMVRDDRRKETAARAAGAAPEPVRENAAHD